MKKLHLIKIILLGVLTITLSSCEVIEAIFKTGVGVGIFIVVAALVVILIVIGIIRRKS